MYREEGYATTRFLEAFVECQHAACLAAICCDRFRGFHRAGIADLGSCLAKALQFDVCIWKATKLVSEIIGNPQMWERARVGSGGTGRKRKGHCTKQCAWRKHGSCNTAWRKHALLSSETL